MIKITSHSTQFKAATNATLTERHVPPGIETGSHRLGDQVGSLTTLTATASSAIIHVDAPHSAVNSQ